MMNIRVSPEEIRADRMTTAHVEKAVEAIDTDGYVILDNLVAHEHLDVLHVKMTEDSQKLLRAEKWGGAGNVRGHLQQGAPPMAPYVFRDIVSNPFVIQVTKQVLGNGVTGPGGKMFNSFYGGNTNCPGSQEQALHRDHPHLWPNLEQAHPPFALAINIFLLQVTEENGATELWPGSHLNTKAFDKDNIAAQRQVAPPIRAETEKGSIVIRDMRLWHRGMTNHSNKFRHMINMNHNMYWRARRQTLRFAAGCEAAFDSTALDHNAVFTDEPINYLTGETGGA